MAADEVDTSSRPRPSLDELTKLSEKQVKPEPAQPRASIQETKDKLEHFKRTKIDHDINRLELERDRLKEELAQLKNTYKHTWRFRYTFGIVAAFLVVAWQAAILCIVYRLGANTIHLDPSVTITLLSTTTVNVFGFLVIVLKFVFPSSAELSPPSSTK